VRAVGGLRVAVLLVLAVAGIRIWGLPHFDSAPSGGLAVGRPADTQPAVVEKVVDGDTIWVRVEQSGGRLPAGASHKIRLLEIDTPETVHPLLSVQCGGLRATAFAEQLMPLGSTVHLLADEEDVDQYGRFLRYVWTSDGEFFNLEAVRAGHARAVLYEPNDAYIDVMRAAEAEARSAKRGIWGDCGVPQG
jgi:micrococcal nuclease